MTPVRTRPTTAAARTPSAVSLDGVANDGDIATNEGDMVGGLSVSCRPQRSSSTRPSRSSRPSTAELRRHDRHPVPRRANLRAVPELRARADPDRDDDRSTPPGRITARQPGSFRFFCNRVSRSAATLRRRRRRERQRRCRQRQARRQRGRQRPERQRRRRRDRWRRCNRPAERRRWRRPDRRRRRQRRLRRWRGDGLGSTSPSRPPRCRST